jgi:NAD(P)-dependent dehydrogenase (short-subunit alcohol dehydrogenase family)
MPKKKFNVFATCRTPHNADGLLELADKNNQISVLPLDVGIYEEVENLAETIKASPIDILINNAGIWRSSTLGSINRQAWLESFTINSIAPYEVTQALLPNIKKGSLKKVVSITSKMGSIDDNTSGSSYIYRSSKSALNMVMRSLQHDLSSYGIATLTLHPGWVQTDMGGMNALINDEQSVSGMINVIDKLNIKNTGRFIDYDGKPISW